MDGGAQRKVGAGAVALLGAALIAILLAAGQPAAAGGGSGPPLLPDLVVEEPADVILYDEGNRTKTLRLSHTTSNVGSGPVEIYPDLTTTSCAEGGSDGRVAYQVIYGDDNESGAYESAADGILSEEDVGCMIFHKVHKHYHFEDFALYELYREKSGRLKATSEKMSFCVFDGMRNHPGLQGSPTVRAYDFQNCVRDDGTHGISVGWADLYDVTTPGQELDVSGRRRGRYCLVAHADPVNRLAERGPNGEANNSTETRIFLNKRRASPGGFDVKRLDSDCRYSRKR